MTASFPIHSSRALKPEDFGSCDHRYSHNVVKKLLLMIGSFSICFAFQIRFITYEISNDSDLIDHSQENL